MLLLPPFIALERRMGEAMLAASRQGIARMAATPHSVKHQGAAPCA
jgi:hypothetical protein